jgi:hypothetical protein
MSRDLRLQCIFPFACAAWRVSETFEAVGDWLEDLATVTNPRPLHWHLRRAWKPGTPLDEPESKLRPLADPGSLEGCSNDRANEKPHGAPGSSSGAGCSL